MTSEKIQAALRKFYFKPAPFWDKLPAALWNQIQTNTYTLTFKKKTLIYSEGNISKGLYILKKGRAKVFVINNEGTEQIIYFLGKDEVFGHRTIVCNESSPVFVEAIEECTVQCIPRIDFERYLLESPELNKAFMDILGQEFRILVNKLAVFASKPVAERTALALLVLNEKFNDHPGYVMVLNFTREDLASYIGVATETLIRQLKLLKEDRAIIIQGRKIFIEGTNLLVEKAGIF